MSDVLTLAAELCQPTGSGGGVTVVDLFAGPGGADEGLRMAGVTDVVGIEWDTDACATARAAGHDRVQEDVAALDPQDFRCDGLWASPPCQAWSMAGKRAAMADQARLGAHAEACRAGWVPYDPADYADERTPLVLEPLRWADALRPKWLVCEQVPPVADLWAHYTDVLRGWGYHAWAGVLNAADYGIVAQCPLHDTHYPTGPADSADERSQFATALATVARAATTKPDEAWPDLAATVADLLANRIRPAFAEAATCAGRERHLAALAESGEPTTHDGAEVSAWTKEATSGFGVTTATVANIASLLSSCLDDPSVSTKWCTTSTETRRTIVLRTSKSIAATLITGCATGPVTRGVGCGLCVEIATPQTRQRAFLIARLDGPPDPPEPTHAKHPQEAGLFGDGRLPWVTMAQALGWDGDVYTGNFTARDHRHQRGVRYSRPTDEPAPTVDTSPDRWTLASRRDSPSWVAEHGDRPDRTADEPAPSITGEAHRWSFVAAGETGEGRPRDPDRWPAATLSGKGTACWVEGVPIDELYGESSVVRVTVAQAAILQGFPHDYPWQGSKTSQFAQVGNAVPPPLAAAICAGLVDRGEVAA